MRYADDCNIYDKSKRAGQRVLVSVSRFLERDLKLKLLVFSLGFNRNGAHYVLLAKTSKQRIKQPLKQTTKRNRGRYSERFGRKFAAG